MLHHNHGLIGRTLSGIAPKWREPAFMGMQFGEITFYQLFLINYLFKFKQGTPL